MAIMVTIRPYGFFAKASAYFLAWTLLGLFFSSREIVLRTYRNEPMVWQNIMTTWLVGEYIWGVVAFVVLAFGSRWPLDRPVLGRRLALHALFSVVVAGAQLALEATAYINIGTLPSSNQSFWRLCDLNNDTFVSANELNLSTILSRSAAYDPANPGNFRTAGVVDPDVKTDRTRELIVGFDRQLGPTVAVGASYIRRKYDRFNWNDRLNWTSANYRAVNYAPTGCPADARCEVIVYYEPSSALPSAYRYSNTPDRWRDFNGVEVTFQKRQSNHWSLNASVAYNNAVDVFDSPAAYEDPTCVVGQCPGRQIYAPQAGGSGIDNVYINAKWLIKAAGTYQLPRGINLGANVNSRQGYPFPQAIITPNRANSGGTAIVLLDPLGDSRLPTFTQLDLRIDKNIAIGRLQLKPTFDVFNVTNASTVLARRVLQASSVANDISGIVAPRVARFAVQVRW